VRGTSGVGRGQPGHPTPAKALSSLCLGQPHLLTLSTCVHETAFPTETAWPSVPGVQPVAAAHQSHGP
jgi:hypothetical protein